MEHLKKYREFKDDLNEKTSLTRNIKFSEVSQEEQAEIEESLSKLSDDDKKMIYIGRFKRQKNGKYVQVK